MFQPEAKLEFVKRYCPPAAGWRVFVDIDPSEEGRTGGERKTGAARERQARMIAAANVARGELMRLGVRIGGSRSAWCTEFDLLPMPGDRDVVAFHPASRSCVVAEVEADSSGQPEQKLYKAIGQITMAADECAPDGWKIIFTIVVYGDAIARHLARARSLERIGVCGLQLTSDSSGDRWLFGRCWQV